MKNDQYTDKIDNEFTENVFSEVFKYVSSQRLDEIADSYPSNDTLKKEDKLSEVFTEKMERHFKMMKMKERRKRRFKVFVKVAAIITIFFVVSTAVICNVEALRVPVFNFFRQVGDKSTTIYVNQDNADYTSKEDQIHGLYLPSYIPDGYQVDKIINENKHKIVDFVGPKNDTIELSYIFDNETIGIDTEDSQQKEVTVSNHSAQLYIKTDGFCTLLFSYNNNSFILQGNISETDILTMAESLKYNK